MLKRFVFLLFMTLLMAACAAPRENPTALPPTASPIPATIAAAATPVPPTPTPEISFVPKQNDLIFIEFFAIT